MMWQIFLIENQLKFIICVQGYEKKRVLLVDLSGRIEENVF